MPAMIARLNANTVQLHVCMRKMRRCMQNVLSLTAIVLTCAEQQQHLWLGQTSILLLLQTSFATYAQKSVIRVQKNVKNILILSIVKIAQRHVAPVPKSVERWNSNMPKTQDPCTCIVQGSCFYILKIF